MADSKHPPHLAPGLHAVPSAPQPNTAPVLPAALVPQVQALIDAWKLEPGALLPMLHALQDALGHIPPGAVPLIAQALNLSRAEVHGVITYYPHFRQQPAGRHVVQVCRAEACQACGADALLAQAEALLKCKPHETRADGGVTLEPVYCLGLCASSPALVIDDRLHARVTPQRLQALVQQMEAGA